jgi:hypothetical protein
MNRHLRGSSSSLKLVLTSAALIVLAAAPAPAPSTPPLPVLNEKVVAFARSRVGTSVGDGVCTTLAIAALKEAGARSYPMRDPGGEFTWGEPVESFKEALPGDILQFHNTVFQGKKYLSRYRWMSWHQEYPHHTAILAQVGEKGKLVVVLHQNVTMQGKQEKETKNVQETSLPMGSLQKGGWIRIYRPVAASSQGSREMPEAEGEANSGP